MKKLFSVAVALVALTSVVNAADLGGNQSSPDEWVAPVFEGLSVGAYGSLSAADIDVDAGFAGLDGISADGHDYGLTAQYLWGAGDIRLGGFVEAGNSTVEANAFLGDHSASLNKDYNFAGGAMLGIVHHSTMFEMHGGIDWSEWEFKADDYATDAQARSHFFGIGIHHMLDENISLGLTARNYWLASVDVDDADVDSGDVEDVIGDSTMQAIRLELKYNF